MTTAEENAQVLIILNRDFGLDLDLPVKKTCNHKGCMCEKEIDKLAKKLGWKLEDAVSV